MKNLAQKTAFLIFISLGVVSGLYAQESAAPAAAPVAAAAPASSEEKLADIRKLIVLTGGEELGKQMIVDIVDAFKENYPNVPQEFWDEFLNGNDAQKLIESNIAVYDKYLSGDEIKDIIKFYETPSGKKLIEVLPAISQESYASGEEWGYALGKKVRDRLIEKGYITEPAANDQGSAAAPNNEEESVSNKEEASSNTKEEPAPQAEVTTTPVPAEVPAQ